MKRHRTGSVCSRTEWRSSPAPGPARTSCCIVASLQEVAGRGKWAGGVQELKPWDAGRLAEGASVWRRPFTQVWVVVVVVVGGTLQHPPPQPRHNCLPPCETSARARSKTTHARDGARLLEHVHAGLFGLSDCRSRSGSLPCGRRLALALCHRSVCCPALPPVGGGRKPPTAVALIKLDHHKRRRRRLPDGARQLTP